jgi:hypothetical protein
MYPKVTINVTTTIPVNSWLLRWQPSKQPSKNKKLQSDSFPVSHHPSHHSFLAASNISLLASIHYFNKCLTVDILNHPYIKPLLCFTVLSFPSAFVSLSLEHELLPLYDGAVA